MLARNLKKLLLILPLLFVLSVVVFFLRFATPQDPVEQSLGVYQQEDSDVQSYTTKQYEKEARKLGLDKELFYFSIRPNYFPTEANKILLPSDKHFAKKLLRKGFLWQDVKAFLNLKNVSNQSLTMTQVATDLTSKGETSRDYSPLSIDEQSAINNLIGTPSTNFYYPVFRWNGSNNQYHHWIKHFFSSEELRSIQNNALVKPKIKRAIAWTLSLAFFSILLTYGFGIFIGFKRISSNHPFWERLQLVLDFFYTMPFFWIATLAIVFLTTSNYGEWTNLFPSVHSINFNGDGIFVELIQNFKHLVLPIVCVSIHATGFISSMMADNLKLQLSKPYFLTAMQKGLSKNEILKKHGFKNALFPILTMLTNVIPASFSGSLIAEVIFDLPGIGRLLYNSILLADWNMVFPIILLIGVVTSISFWLSDMLYTRLDPRVNISTS